MGQLIKSFLLEEAAVELFPRHVALGRETRKESDLYGTFTLKIHGQFSNLNKSVISKVDQQQNVFSQHYQHFIL